MEKPFCNIKSPKVASGEIKVSPKERQSLVVSFGWVKALQITLPKGGDAIKVIEEKFQVNAATSTASFSVPLPLVRAAPEITGKYSLYTFIASLLF